jgi:FAD/FMN-containing dehydrogenase
MAGGFRACLAIVSGTLRRPPKYGGQVLTDDRTRCAYSEGAGPYRIVPEAVAVPRDAADVSALVAAAADGG